MTTPTRTLHRQHGAALITSLIVLLLLTVMGVSGIRNATLEESMAFNAQAKSITFQASETALGAVVTNQESVLDTAIGSGIGSVSNNDYSAMANPPGAATAVSATTTTTYIGRQLPDNSSLETWVSYTFDVRATGAMADASATSVHLLGIKRQMPRDDVDE